VAQKTPNITTTASKTSSEFTRLLAAKSISQFANHTVNLLEGEDNEATILNFPGGTDIIGRVDPLNFFHIILSCGWICS